MAERTDRELLELAAKAAGIERGADRLDCGLSLTGADGRHRPLTQWNPLTDDGDALRLAVAVSKQMDNGLLIMPPDKFDPWAIVRDWSATLDGGKDASEDPYAATRRAIVLAAVALGAKE